jgi:type IX secretion system PorP/SprF family membrane protein
MKTENISYMKYFRFITVFCFLLGSAAAVTAQQVPMYSQYVMNGFLVNPSLAGRDGYSTVNLTAREQWLGIKDGPSTYALSFQTTLLRNSFISKSKSVRRRAAKPTKPSRVGLGGYLFNDNNGIIRRTGLQASYAYHLPLGTGALGQSDLSMGLAMSTYQYALATSDLNYGYDDDPYLSQYDKSVFITDFNFGVSYTTTKYYVGFTMTNMLRGSLIYGNNGENKRGELGHYFLTGGVTIPINKEWSVKPSAFIKSSDLVFKSMQLDLSGRVFYKDSYWGGLSYRTNEALILLLGMKYDKYYVAYAYDLLLTDIRKNSFGTMELTLAVKFGESSRRYRWLNAF